MLESVNVSEVLPFSGTVLPPKALPIAGALTMVRVADAGVPLPAAVELIVTLLVYELSVAETTLTLIEHEPVASEAFVKLMAPAPAVAVTVPPQVFDRPFGDATTSPAGSVSAKLASMLAELALVMLKVS